MPLGSIEGAPSCPAEVMGDEREVLVEKWNGSGKEGIEESRDRNEAMESLSRRDACENSGLREGAQAQSFER